MKKLSILLFFCFIQFFASAQWTQLNSGTNANLKGVFFINSDTGFAVGWHFNNANGIVLKTTNGGLTWDSIDYGLSNNVYDVSFVNDQVGFICGEGFISKTTDQGNTWDILLSNAYQPKQIQFLDESLGYFQDNGIFQKTTDGGITWTTLEYPFVNVYDFCFSSEDTGMIADLDDEGEFAISSTFDGGLTWTQSLLGGVYSDIFGCLTHIENQKWLAIRIGMYADITTDGGQTWTSHFMDSVPNPYNSTWPYKDVKFPTPNDGWAVGTNYIINSHDGGYTWAVNDTTPDSLDRVFFPNPQVGYAVGIGGLIMEYQATASCSANFDIVADTLIPHHYWGVNTSTGLALLSYYWSWGDGSFDSIPYPSHTYAAEGFYTICLTIHDSTGCTDSTCYSYQLQKMSSAEAGNTMVYVNIVADIPTTFQNPEAQQQLEVFPNPVQGYLFINLATPPNEVRIHVYDLEGDMIAVPIIFTNSQAQLATTNLPDGFYTLQITNSKTGKIEVEKFVKQ